MQCLASAPSESVAEVLVTLSETLVKGEGEIRAGVRQGGLKPQVGLSQDQEGRLAPAAGLILIAAFKKVC